MYLALVVLLVSSFAACYTDVRWGKIPNTLVASLFVCGITIQFVQGTNTGIAAAAAAAAVLIVGLVAFALHIMGGGDIKFFVAAAATLGPQDAARYILFTFVCGGVAAIVFSLSRGTLKTMLANVHVSALTLSAPAVSGRFPYAIAMLGGAVILAVAETTLPFLRFPL